MMGTRAVSVEDSNKTRIRSFKKMFSEYSSALFFAGSNKISLLNQQAKNAAPAVFTTYSRNLFQPLSKIIVKK
jgi:hypothetical protein